MLIKSEAQKIVTSIANKESEIRKMGFASIFLEAIEKSITDLVHSQLASLGEEMMGMIPERERMTDTIDYEASPNKNIGAQIKRC